jgi:hypothetical protein
MLTMKEEYVSHVLIHVLLVPVLVMLGMKITMITNVTLVVEIMVSMITLL